MQAAARVFCILARLSWWAASESAPEHSIDLTHIGTTPSTKPTRIRAVELMSRRISGLLLTALGDKAPRIRTSSRRVIILPVADAQLTSTVPQFALREAGCLFCRHACLERFHRVMGDGVVVSQDTQEPSVCGAISRC